MLHLWNIFEFCKEKNEILLHNLSRIDGYTTTTAKIFDWLPRLLKIVKSYWFTLSWEFGQLPVT